MEKCYKYNKDIHKLFVDFRQPYDSILRTKLYQAMYDLEISHKLIRLVHMTLYNTRCKVKVENWLLNELQVNQGLSQVNDCIVHSSLQLSTQKGYVGGEQFRKQFVELNHSRPECSGRWIPTTGTKCWRNGRPPHQATKNVLYILEKTNGKSENREHRT